LLVVTTTITLHVLAGCLPTLCVVVTSFHRPGLHEWYDVVWPVLELPPPEEVPHISPVKAVFSERAVIYAADDERAIQQFYTSDEIHAVSCPIVCNELMCRPDYNRDFRTLRIAKGSLNYELGDALEIFPQNDPEKVAKFLQVRVGDC